MEEIPGIKFIYNEEKSTWKKEVKLNYVEEDKNGGKFITITLGRDCTDEEIPHQRSIK